jgi:acyl-homoserine-lactone acylase
VFNAISDRWDENGPGYSEVRSGSSFVMATELGGRCPRDRSILTYSLSENPESPHYSDQTRMFSNKKWIDPPFCAKEVREQSRSSEVIRAPKNG